MAYLKYYFGYIENENKLFLDRVEVDGDIIPSPENFLKWYEEGDIEFQPLTEDQKEYIHRSDSPLFAALLLPQKVTFSVEELLKTRALK